MQNYTYFEQNSKTFFKKCIFTAIIYILQHPFPPPEATIAFPPPCRKNPNPPPAGPFCTSLLPQTTVPKYGSEYTRYWSIYV